MDKLTTILIRQDQASKRLGRRLTLQNLIRNTWLGFVFIFLFIVLPWVLMGWLEVNEKSYFFIAITISIGVILLSPLDEIAQQYRLKQLLQQLNDFVVLDESCFYNKVDVAEKSWQEIANKVFGQWISELLDENSIDPAVRKFRLASPLPFSEASVNRVFSIGYSHELRQWNKLESY